MSVTGRYVGEGIECACTDRYTAGCDCVTGAVAEYFQCTGSTAVAGMPCTRHAHCNPGGLCDGTPRCLKPGTVWEPGGSPPYISSTCRTDDDCANEPDGRTQCGYRLFNLGDRKETFSRIIKLDRKVVPNAPRVRRGFCSNVTYKTCTSKGPPQLYNMCLGGQGECRGYWLEAGEQVTKP